MKMRDPLQPLAAGDFFYILLNKEKGDMEIAGEM